MAPPPECPSEDQVLCFAQGQLIRSQRAALESHVRACLPCEQLVAAALAASGPPAPADGLDSPSAPGLPRGTLVGRYTVLWRVGRGATSEVYAAYDAELDRRVALKLLAARPDPGDPRAEARLLREARAVARLSHPNVIGVFDAGRFGDRIFLAMEYVDGQTLAAWLREQPRAREDVLKVFSGAARGLAAAHASGLVHRDFKPENVMVARDGTARVTDFGLVQRLYAAAEPEPETSAGDAASATLDLTLTRPGELVGTPLYMSPEQLTRRQTDERTDQFSLCVALYQALYHEHPFLPAPETDIDRLIDNVVAGRVRPPPASVAVPPWIRRVLLRGMAASPQARWPSMSDLATALEQDPARTRRRWAFALAAAGSMALAIVIGRMAHPGAPLCQGGPSRLADVWPVAPGAASPREAALAAAFARSGRPGAQEIAGRVAGLLSRYAEKWLAMYRDACEATHVRGEQSAEVLDLRMQCLDERRGSLRALTDALVAADATTVGNAIDAANALPDLGRCGDAASLRAVVPPAPTGNIRARVDDLRRRAVGAKVAHDTGRGREAIEQGRALVKEARALGYEPLLAELLEMLGSFQFNDEFQPDTLDIIQEATWTAMRARRDDIAARCAIQLAGYSGDYANRPDEADHWAALARVLLDRIGPGHEQTQAWLLIAMAQAQQGRDLALAQRDAQEAVTLAKRVLPADHPDIAWMLNTLAETKHRRGDQDGAISAVREAREVLTRAYGPHASQVALVMSNEGEYLTALGRPAEALPLFREALADWEAALGPDFRFLAYPLTGLGRALLALGRPGDARAPLERALRLREKGEPRPVERAETEFALARVLWADGERRRARGLAASARDEYARVGPARQQQAEVASWILSHRG